MLRFVGSIYSCIFLVIFLSVADIALGHRGLLPAGATVCALLGLLPIATSELLRNAFSGSRSCVPPSLRDNAYPLLALGLIATCALLLSILPEAYWSEDGKWIFLIPYGCLISLVSVTASGSRSIRGALPFASLVSLALLLWSISCDLTTPGTFSAATERAAGFSGNANYTALVTVMVCAASLDYDVRRPLFIDLLFLLLSASIVFISLSRSGMLNLLLLIVGFVTIRLFRARPRPRRARSSVASILAVALLLLTLSPLFATQISALTEQSRFKRALSGRQIDDGSAASRLAAAQDALRRINDAPLVGHGTGYARRMPELPHNLYLQQWVNNGVPGLLSYIAFLLVSLGTFFARRYYAGVMLMVAACVGSFFSHNILDQRPFLILYGLLLGISSHRAPNPANSRYPVVACEIPKRANTLS